MMPSREDDEHQEGALPSERPLRASRIILGSCNSQHYEQLFWKVIRDRNPAAFVWAGDAVYADDRLVQPGGDDEPSSTPAKTRWWWPFPSRFRSRPLDFAPATPEYLRELYRKQLQVTEYRDLIEGETSDGEKISIFGAMDDHDYGINNGDKTFPFRTESGIEFTKFLGLTDEASAMSRRAVRGLGVYGVQVYDFSSTNGRLLSDSEAGLDPDVVTDETYNDRANHSNNNDSNSEQSVAIFVLDVRSNKTPWAKELFALDPEGDFLGEDQWKWFETAIGRSKAQVNIVVSGIQVLAPWFYDVNKVENWSGFPKAQHRLYQTLLQPNVRAPILFSGDIHMAQFLRKDCRKRVPTFETGRDGDDSETDTDAVKDTSHHRSIIRPLYEVTSSGMTHSWSANAPYCGRPNKSKLCTFYPFNVVIETVMTYVHFVSPWTALLKGNDDDRGGIGVGSGSGPKRSNGRQLQYTLERNVAEVELDWKDNLVTVRILGEEGQTLLRQDWSMDRLTGGTSTSTSTTESATRKFVGADETLLTEQAFETGQDRLESSLQRKLPRDHEDYICVNYRGNIPPVHFALSIASTVGVGMLLGLAPVWVPAAFLVHLLLRWRRRRRCAQKRNTAASGAVVVRPKTD
eukprot:jgi/Psemu1/317474/estExt_fgenesh1_pm.C_120011